VASYGDFFAEKRHLERKLAMNDVLNSTITSLPVSVAQNGSATDPQTKAPEATTVSASKKRNGREPDEDGPIECLVYRDPFSGVYKKYIFSADGKYLLGGMMVIP
jgi:nitrite reductase (NAD(P)H)